MARLFITEREIKFISDITKEIVKDVNGQVIFIYPISEIKTTVHDVYNEAIKKIYDNPIAVDALVSAQYHQETKIGKFGPDQQYQVEAYVQYRDLVHKGIDINIGDFFSYGEIFYEVTNINVIKNIFGQVEHKDGIKIVGTKTRESQFKAQVLGPTDIGNVENDAVQKLFVQQRGFAENKEGETNDNRELQVIIDKPLTGPKEVSEQGAASDNSNHGTSFYDE